MIKSQRQQNKSNQKWCTNTHTHPTEGPGPDRIIFNPNLNGACVYVGAITHTGASRNGFVPCSETLASKTTPTTSSGSGPSSTETTTPTSTSELNGAGGLVGGARGAGVVVGAVVGWWLL
jgi:hypothetical protein